MRALFITLVTLIAALSVSCCGGGVASDLSKGVSDTPSTSTSDDTSGGELDYIFYDSDADDFD
jgi:hypothetical protein